MVLGIEACGVGPKSIVEVTVCPASGSTGIGAPVTSCSDGVTTGVVTPTFAAPPLVVPPVTT